MPGAGTVAIESAEWISGHLSVINGVDPTWKIYVAALTDTPGVVATNNFLSVFNPVGSGVHMVGLGAVVGGYAIATSQTPNSMLAQRISAASGGTLATAANVSRYDATVSNPLAQVRTANPTVTLTQSPLFGWPPPVSTGTGALGVATPAASGPAFICHPGEGLVWYTVAGNVNQLWNIQYTWAEYPI